MKVIIFTLSIVSVLCASAILLAFAPYHFYNEALSSGLDGPYLSLSAPEKSLIKGESYQLEQMPGLISGTDNLWEFFHFSNMNLPFPIKHPQVQFLPKIEEKDFGLSLGGRYLDVNNDEIANFMVTESFPLVFSTKGQKLFNLPIYKKLILGTTKKKLWRDLFTLDLELPKVEGRYLSGLEELWEIPYETLVYNLYVLYLRKHIFKGSPLEISFYKDKNIGVLRMSKGAIKVKDEHLGIDKRYYEKYFFLDKAKVYTISVSIKENDIIAESIRRKIVEKMQYRHSDENASALIYGRYKRLSYSDKISQLGMIFLYTAWSHVPEEKNFLSKMIQFLERGKDNILFLTPLYEYAFKKFGTNFSENSDARKEDATEMLKRKMQEELDSEIDAERNKHISGNVKEFESDKEKIKYHLDNAKIKGSDADDNDDVITVE